MGRYSSSKNRFCRYRYRVQSGILGLRPQLAGSTNYFTNYSYTTPICLSENFDIQIKLKNNPTEGGQPAYDVGFGLDTDNGTIGFSMMSNDPQGQPFTFFMVNNQRIFENSPLLVRDLRQWSVLKIKLYNRVLTLSHDDVIVFTGPFSGGQCWAERR